MEIKILRVVTYHNTLGIKGESAHAAERRAVCSTKGFRSSHSLSRICLQLNGACMGLLQRNMA